MNPSRFEEIAGLFFRVCVEHGVSFQILQRAAYKHRIVIFGLDRREIIFEFWPHAELTTRTPRQGSSFLTYQRFLEAREAGFAEQSLALLYVCHLFFKNKDLSKPEVKWRLSEFVKRMDCVVESGERGASFAGKVREILGGIMHGEVTLGDANQAALKLLDENEIKVETSGMAKWSRMQVKIGRIFKGWGARVFPCVGPDGSGKTHFIAALMDLAGESSFRVSSIRFKNLYRKNRIYSTINKRYRVSRNLPKNSADESLAPLLFCVALPSYVWQIFKSLNKQAVFMDRFFLEFMVRGYRESDARGIKSVRGYSLMCKLIPSPRKMIVLTADYELITSRKAELSAEAIQDFYTRYLEFSVQRKISSVLFLNTHLPGDELAKRCLQSLGILDERG